MQESSAISGSVTIATSAPTCEAKNKSLAYKWNWLHSLTRDKKKSFYESCSPITTERSIAPQQSRVNNSSDDDTGDVTRDGKSAPLNDFTRNAKLQKNMFQRFKLKMCRHLLATKLRGSQDVCDDFANNSKAESLYHSSIHDQRLHSVMDLNYNNCTLASPDESDIVPFTLHYKRFVAKKWLEGSAAPNRVMYKASSEMLGQVWYWGEISKCDAQKQLTDKPTGSFLVRDSETSGSQFTLSFRIVNVTLHYRLEYRDNYWHFEELQYESIVEMIEDILFRCTNDNFVCFVCKPRALCQPFPVILKYPLSRYLKIPNLQDLCRRVIQRTIMMEEIEKIPLPPKLHKYLNEKRELIFN